MRSIVAAGCMFAALGATAGWSAPATQWAGVGTAFLGHRAAALFRVERATLTSRHPTVYSRFSVLTYDVEVAAEHSLPEKALGGRFHLMVRLGEGPVISSDEVMDVGPLDDWFPLATGAAFVAAFDAQQPTSGAELFPLAYEGAIGRAWQDCTLLYRTATDTSGPLGKRIAGAIDERTDIPSVLFFRLLLWSDIHYERGALYSDSIVAQALGRYLKSPAVPLAARTEVVLTCMDVPLALALPAREALARGIAQVVVESSRSGDPVAHVQTPTLLYRFTEFFIDRHDGLILPGSPAAAWAAIKVTPLALDAPTRRQLRSVAQASTRGSAPSTGESVLGWLGPQP